MRIQPSLLWSWNRTIDRAPYLAFGVLFFLIKFASDWTIAGQGFGRSWSPLNYLIWPNDRVLRVFELGDPDRAFSLTMVLASLPFIWAGVILTLHRLRAAGLPLVLAALFFVPLVNLLLFLVLVLLPPRKAAPAEASIDEPVADATDRTEALATGIMAEPPPLPRRPFEPLREMHRSIVLESSWRSGLLALALTVPLAVAGVLLGAHVFQSYGFSLFVGAPFALGMVSVLMFGFSRPQPFGQCLLVAGTAAVLAGMAIVIVALEGLICLIMAAPIAYCLALMGGFVGYAIQSRPWLNDHTMSVTLGMVLLLPSLMAAESRNEPEPDLRAINTEVIIDAPPERVWQFVVAFPPLDEPDDWFFQTGVAYPQKAEIKGTGVGAVPLLRLLYR